MPLFINNDNSTRSQDNHITHRHYRYKIYSPFILFIKHILKNKTIIKNQLQTPSIPVIRLIHITWDEIRVYWLGKPAAVYAGEETNSDQYAISN